MTDTIFDEHYERALALLHGLERKALIAELIASDRREIERLRDLLTENTKLRWALKTLIQYANHQINEGFPHHPTLPSAAGEAELLLSPNGEEQSNG